MTNGRIVVLPLFALGVAASFPALGQSVVSTHSGVVYFFEGSVFIRDERLEQRFGKYPDIGEGRELRTEQGRAEVLLTPGVFLRIDENSAIRVLSNKLSDTRIEFLRGSAIVESNEGKTNTSVKLIHKSWQMRVAREGVYRIDSDPPQVRVYRGEVDVLRDGNTETVAVRDGEVVPFAAVLVPEPSTTAEGDSFKNWAMSRSQAISEDNAISAEIVDDPSKIDATGVAVGAYSYFPPTGIPSLGIATPYGLSFWSPWQPTFGPISFPSYTLGTLYFGWPGVGRYGPGRTGTPPRTGGGLYPRSRTSPPYTPLPRTPLPYIPPHSPAPHPGFHGGAHR